MYAVQLTASSPAPARVRLGVAAVLLLATCALAAGVANAAQKKPKSSGPSLTDEYVYRCKSASGHSFFGQNIPSECMGADVEVLDQTGRVVRMIPGAKSLEQIAAQKAADDARAAAAQRDRTLLATYLIGRGHRAAARPAHSDCSSNRRVTRQYIANLRDVRRG